MTLIIFDVDGTLVYSDRRDSKTFALTYEHIYKRPFPSIDLSTYPHVTDYTIFSTVIKEHFNRAINRAEVALFQNLFVERLKVNRSKNPAYYQEVKGASAMIRQLQSHPGYDVAIATGGWAAPARIKLSHVDINHKPMVLVGGDQKPTREDLLNQCIQLSQSKYAQSYKKIVYVGDAQWDVQTTRNLNLSFIGVRRKGDLDRLHQLGAQQVIQDYTDFQAFKALIPQAQSPSRISIP